MHDWNDRMGGGWWWMALVMAVVLVGLVWLVVKLVRGSAPAAPSAPSARDLLAERLARGEIDAEEYHTRLDALSHHAPS